LNTRALQDDVEEVEDFTEIMEEVRLMAIWGQGLS
jgi:hypothetical protein